MTRSQLAPRVAAAIVLAAGALVLTGWALDVQLFKRIVPDAVAMNPVTAVAFMLAGLSLWLLQVEEEGRSPARRLAQTCAGVVALGGLLKLCALLGGPDARVDQWLFPAKLAEAGNALPNRMAPNTALNFVLIGGALLLLDVQTRRRVYPAQLFALVAALTALFATIGYAYNASSFYRVGGFIPMALHTALCFMALAAGILGARPHRGIIAIFTSHGQGGIVARRLLPAVILVPFVLGWLRLAGEQAGLYGTAFGVSLMVTVTIFVFMALIGWTAGALERTDAERRQSQEELQALSRLLAEANYANQRILDYSLDVICTIDEAGRFIQVSPACEKVWGYTPAELAGRKYIDLVCPEDVEATNQAALAIVSGAATSNFENRYICKDGAPVPMIWSAVWSETEKIMFCVARDNSERKRAEEQLAAAAGRVTNILESITEAFIAVDKEWRFTYVNDEAERLLMRPRDELLGHSLWEEFPETVGTTFDNQYHRAVSGGLPVTFEEFYPPLNVWFEVHAYPSVEGLSVYFQDVTARKQAEETLHQAKEEAERANAAKSEFLSRMSHELRTPLNAILGFGQLLEMDELDAGQRDGVQQILKGGRHLLELVNEVLDIASIDAGRMTLSAEPVQLSRLAQEAIALVQPLADERRIRFENAIGGGFVLADQQRLKQVLLNLLSNAVKYNREGGLVRVASGTAAVPGRVRFEVTDSGPGIAPAGLEKLFAPFERLNAAEKGVEGTGIGLTISQRLVQVMSGEIGVYSVQGEGTTFWVELPGAQDPMQSLKHSEAIAPLVAETAASNGATHSILYIEDNLSNLNLIEHILGRRKAIRLLSAMQGRRGLEMAREHRPDLILLDLHLPDIQGDEVLQHLRAEAETQNIPVVMLSADATPRQIERLLEAGAKAYLTKPLNVKQFMAVLDETLKTGDYANVR